ncbi:acetate kinase [Apiospora arundinis]|uniref:Acetate kinase n=1 Tax=Apiospora arundinis TaxID=335852 RepID=A0ABR2J661_9PEZI
MTHAMAASFSSSSSRSYASSSFSVPPAYTPNSNLASSAGSNWTPNSAVSALTDELSSPPGQLRPLDLGPPGYQATIVLFEGLPEEKTVYLGPWEVVGSEHRRIVWRCSYQLELLEHFLPSPHPADTFPHTLHSLHRQFSDPCLLEQYVTFREAHRVRYTAEDGVVIFDQPMEVKYEFTTIESAIHFQGDLRRKDLIDCFDIDVVWSDTHSRTDTFGNVRGIGTAQRLKLWSDRQNSAHSISIFANRSDRRFREYPVDFFEGEVRGRDDRRRMLRLNVRGRRGSAPDSRRNPLAAFRRHSDHSHSSSSVPRGGPLDIRYLGIQFTRPEDYRRFLDTWIVAHSSDSEFRGIAYPQDAFELPSPEIPPDTPYELPPPSRFHQAMTLPTVLEPEDDDPTP